MSLAASRVPLESLCSFHGGGTPRRSNTDYFGGAIPWVSPKDMKSWELTDSQLRLTAAGLSNSPAKLVPANSVLVVVRSGVLKHRLPVAINCVPVALNQDMKALVCSDRLDAVYLARFLQWSAPRVLTWVRGTTADNIPVSRLKSLEVPVPSLAEQRRIAAMLDRADAIRRKRRDAIELLDELLRSAFLEMFGDPVTNPKGWEMARLGDVADITTGSTPPRSKKELYGDAIEWIKSDNINTEGHYLTKAAEGLSVEGCKNARIVGPDAVLMTCIAGSRSCIGNVAIADRSVSFNQQINAIEPRIGLDVKFLYTQFWTTKSLVQRHSTDSMKGLVTKGNLADTMIILPPAVKQVGFRRWFEQWQGIREAAKTAEDLAGILLESLAHVAFGGPAQASITDHSLEGHPS